MKKWILLVAVIGVLSGCSSLKFWDKEDSAGEDEIHPAKLVKFSEEVRIRKIWSSGVGASRDEYAASLQPALGTNSIYAADNKGRVTALDINTGKRLWRTDLDVPLSGGLGLGGSLVLVGTMEGGIYVLDASSGSVRWQSQLSSEVLSAPAANDDVVVVQTEDGKLVALDNKTGERRWKVEFDVPVLTLRGTGTPLVTKGTVIAGFATGKLYSLNATNGAINWESRVVIPKGRTELQRMSDLDGEPILVGDIIYSTSYQGRLVALARGTGRNLWAQNSSSFHQAAYGSDQVYAVETDDEVRAYRAASGQVLWSNDQLSHRRLTAPIVVADYLAVADDEGYLHLLSQTDGHFVGRIKVDGSGVVAPMVTDGERLYVLDNDGDLTAYRFQ